MFSPVDDIRAGLDPLGEALVALRSAAQRRTVGAVYTPTAIVQAMLRWLQTQDAPARIVDPGAGSGRFTVAAGLAFPNAQLVAVEIDPLAALVLRANLAVAGLAARTEVVVGDFRTLRLPPVVGRTAFIGNPPYVRHHDIPADWKAWYSRHFAELGIRASALAGLHLHFFLQTRLLAQPGDIGAYITSAEWLDVNYGSALRALLLQGLGGVSLDVLEPSLAAFPGTATTAAVTCFRVAGVDQVAPQLRLQSVSSLADLRQLGAGAAVDRDRLASASRWSTIVRPAPVRTSTGGEIAVGDLFRVHRGQVTGGNAVWIAGEHALQLPERVLTPAVTKAKDLISAGSSLDSPEGLRRVVDLPADLSGFTPAESRRIQAFLAWAKGQGADASYIARHRKAWWAVGLKAPAPILCTYMARRPPQFTLNRAGARHINIAHGLYPREDLPPELLVRVVAWLNGHVQTASGRTYAGGLTKFEPREIERLRLPAPADLMEAAA